MDDFRVETVRDERHAVVSIVGELDAATAPALREELLGLAGDGIDRVVLDCRGLAFVDSFGLGVIVAAKKRLSRQGNAFCLVASPDQRALLRVLEITGLDQVLSVHATVAEAVDACLRDDAA